MMLFKLAWRNIWRNYKRTLITVASIFFAVLLAFVMSSMQEGSYEQMIKNSVGMYSGYIQVHADGYWEERSLENTFEGQDSMQAFLESLPGVTHAVPRLESFALASTGDLTKGAMIVGISPEKEKYLLDPAQNLVAGEYLEPDDLSVLIGKGLATNLNAQVGDTVVVFGRGYHGINAAGKYNVKGIVDMPSPELNQRIMFLPLTEAQYMFAAEGRLTAFALLVNDYERTQPIITGLERNLDTTHYEIMGWKEMNPDLVQSIEADRGGGYIMLLILYMVVGFGIFGTVIMMTMERRKEFGILIGIGMHPWRISVMVVQEILMIALTGILAGFLVALPILVYLYHNPIPLTGDLVQVMEEFGMEAVIPFSLDASIFTRQFITVLIISSLTAIYPVYKINRQSAVSATHD